MTNPNTHRWADFFDSVRETIEAAENPFAKMAIFILPILSPLVPASFTGVHMFKLFQTIFTFAYAVYLSAAMALIIGVVLEMLGYVGAITFIKSLFRLVRAKGEAEYWLPFVLNLFAYLFYLVAMFMINVRLGEYFQTPAIINSIVGTLSFITVPTGLLAANHLSQKEEDEHDNVIRQEGREDRLKAKALKAGINIFQQTTPVQPEAQSKNGRSAKMPGDFKDYVMQLLDETNGQIKLTDITLRVNRDKRVEFLHKDVKGTWFKYFQQWKRSHPE